MIKLGIKLIRWLFTQPLSVEESLELTEFILKEIGALPLRDTIYMNENNELIINGYPIDQAKAVQLRQTAISALENPALNLIREQVAFTAIAYGVHKAEVPAQMFFARAAIWWGEEVEKKLKLLAQKKELPLLEE